MDRVKQAVAVAVNVAMQRLNVPGCTTEVHPVTELETRMMVNGKNWRGGFHKPTNLTPRYFVVQVREVRGWR